jgi:sugar O-acyltransferase (sialic acid O-acetyltransferase NeuD family)
MERTNSKHQIVVYGAGGLGREVAELFGRERAYLDVCAFAIDSPDNVDQRIHGLDVLSLANARARFPEAQVVVAVGDPQLRRMLVDRAASVGFDFATLVHPRAIVSHWCTLGEGTIVSPGCTLSSDVLVGRHVQMNVYVTVGHNSIIGEFASIESGAHISGWVSVGAGSYIGAGAVILQGSDQAPLAIGDGAIIGAGACVTKPVGPGLTVVGVPARPIAR